MRHTKSTAMLFVLASYGTMMTQNLQNDPKAQADIDNRHPYGSMGTPEEVAKSVLFLVSDDVGWIQGVALPVDGGFLTT